MPTLSEIIIRDAVETDIPFIYASWLNSYKYDSLVGSQVSKDLFFSSYREVLDAILANENTQVLVAANREYPNTIYGWLCWEQREERGVLHYVFVKEAFRYLYIAENLYKSAFLRSSKVPFITHKTGLAVRLCERFQYNPFLLYKQGVSNV